MAKEYRQTNCFLGTSCVAHSIGAFFLSICSLCNLTDLFFFLSLAFTLEQCDHASEMTLTAFRRCSFFCMRCLLCKSADKPLLFSLKRSNAFHSTPSKSLQWWLQSVCCVSIANCISACKCQVAELPHTQILQWRLYQATKKKHKSKFQWYFEICNQYFWKKKSLLCTTSL